MSGNPFSPARLIITMANGSVVEHDLGPAGMKVGRGPANDLVLEDSFASTNHAVFRTDGPEWVIQDLGSANGTRVNNARVSGFHVLKNGDVVQIGHTKFIFSPSAAAGGHLPPKYPEPAAAVTPGLPFLRVFTGVGKVCKRIVTGRSGHAACAAPGISAVDASAVEAIPSMAWRRSICSFICSPFLRLTISAAPSG